MFIKTIFKNSKKVKRIKSDISECNLYLYFLILQNLHISYEKNTDVSRTQEMHRVIYVFFLSSSSDLKLCKVSALKDISDRF